MPRIWKFFAICLLFVCGAPLPAQDSATDPYVVAQAAALGNNPSQIFAFVRDQIGVEIYAGSVRGARGALWTRAANSLDRASLLVALLRASGFQARYVRGELGYLDQTSKTLIGRLFPFRSRLAGCPPTGAILDNPEFDGILNIDVRPYFWVEYGPSWTPLDPNLLANTAGQSYQTALERFESIPESLRQKITFRLKAETYALANSLFKLGPGSSTVLEKTYNTAELVGRPVSVGNFVTETGLNAPVFTAATITYTPYFFIGSGGPDVSADAVVTGSNYQEFYTNYPLGSTVLTGLFLEIDAKDETNATRTYRRTIFDRLGPAGRAGLAPVNVSISGTPQPAVSDFDIVTVNALPGLQDLPAFNDQKIRLSSALGAYQAIKPQVAQIPTSGPLTNEQQALVQQAITFQRNIVIAQNEMITMGYNGGADAFLKQMEQGYAMKASYNSPRLTLAIASFADGNATFKLDILKNAVRLSKAYFQNRSAGIWAEVVRGLIESHLEGSILAQVTGKPAISIGDILGALGDPQKLTVISSQNLPTLDTTTLSANAKALITAAVNGGKVVLTPVQMVNVNGQTTVAWFETAPNGHTISVFEDGGHQAIASWAGVQVTATKYNQKMAQFIGQVEGIGAAGIAFSAGILNGVASATSYAGVLKAAKQAVAGVDTGAPDLVNEFWKKTTEALEKLKKELPAPVEQGFSLIDSYATGLKEGIEFAQNWLKANLPVDPPALPFIGSPLGPGIPAVAPGASAAVQTALSPDTLYTLPINGLEYPLINKVTITNKGPAADTFRITTGSTQGFRVYPTAEFVTLGPGQVIELGLCMAPWDSQGFNFPSAGVNQPFSVTATSTTNSAINSTSSGTLTQPAVPSLQLATDPPVLYLPPGASIPARLNISSLGNAAPGVVSLAASTPPGVTLSGLNSPVSPAAYSVITQNVMVGVPANAPIGSTQKINLAATYNPGNGPQTVRFTLPVTVVASGQCALESSTFAQQINRTNLAGLLNQLAFNMNSAAVNTSDEALRSRIAADLNEIISDQLNAPYLQPLSAPLTTSRDAIQSSTAATILANLGLLNTNLCSLRDALKSASNYKLRVHLSPSSLVTGPNLPVTYTINLTNEAAELRTFDLSVTGVPGGVAALFSANSITLGPQGSNFNSNFNTTLTLTPGAAFVAPFDFQVVATPRGAPAFARSAPGSLQVRPETVAVDSVSSSPNLVNPLAVINVSARIFSAVNQARRVYARFILRNSADQAVTFPFGQTQVDLTTTATLQTVNFPAYTLPANVTNGVYSIEVTAIDESGAPVHGAVGKGSLIVGAPFSVSLRANPSAVPPGNAVVQASLTLNRDTIPNPVSTLIGSVAVTGTPRSMALYTSGSTTYAYVCSDSAVNIVDVTVPATPSVAGTFGSNLLVPPGFSGYAAVTCGVYSDNLIVSYSRENGNTTTAVIPTYFAVYSLANPLNPVLRSQNQIPRPDASGFTTSGTNGFMRQDSYFYNIFSNFIFQQFGDILSLDLANVPATGALSVTSSLFPPPAGDANRGGPNRILGFRPVNPTTLYAASTNAEGGNVLRPGNPPINGRLLVVDTTNPAAMSVASTVNVPAAAYLTDVAILGNIAVAVGDSDGVYDALSGFRGKVTISSFDISNPLSPVLLNSVVTQLSSKGGAGIVPLSNNTFAVGGTELGTNRPALVLVDASVPTALRYLPYDAIFVSTPKISNGNYFYSLSGTSLGIFELSTINGPQVSVTMRVRKTGGAALVPNSFNQTPSSMTPGVDFDTYVWLQPNLDTITFNMNLTGLNAGDVRQIVQGGSVDFTLPSFGPGSVVLPPLAVLTEHIMSISPDNPFVRNGERTDFTVSLRNPANTQQTFNISTFGLPSDWFTFPSQVVAPASSTVNFTVGLTPPLNTTGGGFTRVFPFTVAANALSGISGSAAARPVLVENPNLGPNSVATTFNISATVAPSTVTVGRGGAAQFVFNLTNTGNAAGTVLLNTNNLGLPSGWTSALSAPFMSVPPGLGNSRTIVLTINVSQTAAAGSYPFNIPVQVSLGPVLVTLQVTVDVVPNAVRITFNPASGGPATVYQATITNIGTAADTFDLAAAGPLADKTAVGAAFVNLNAGASTVVNVTVTSIASNLAGTLPVQLKAVSRAAPSVFALGSANLVVPQSRGVQAALAPTPSQISNPPGSVALSLQTQNTGNLDDTYSAVITGTTGPVTANLVGPGGVAGNSISSFAVPALGSAAFLSNVQLTAAGTGTVTVKVTSLTDPAVFSNAVATIQSPAPQEPPVTSAGANRSVPLNRLARLDGSATFDNNQPPLPVTYAWTLVSAPPGSAVTSASIRFANQPIAVFRPDVLGAYVFKLTGTNTVGSRDATVTITAENFPPVAIGGTAPGSQVNSKVNQFAWLNGKNSYDPDGSPLTFNWTLVQVPNGSAVTGASIRNAQTPRPYFKPDVAGAYVFQLAVNDGVLASLPDTVTVNAFSANVPPNADAGAERNAKVNAQVVLDGSKSADPDGGPQPVTFLWTFVQVPQGSALTSGSITNANTPAPRFTPDAAGDYLLNLRVSDGAANSDARVTVRASSANGAPNAISEAPEFARPNTVVNASGAGSGDTDTGPETLARIWWFNALAPASAAVLNNPTSAAPGFTPDKSGFFILRQEAHDGLDAGFSNALVTAAAACDADANGLINTADMDLINAALGSSTPPNDPRDANSDGQVTQADITACTALLNPAERPNLAANPVQLTFTGLVGTTPPAQLLTLSSTGIPQDYAVTTDQPWLQAAPAAGNTTSPNNTVTVSVNTAGIGAGTQNGKVRFTSATAGNSPHDVPVTLNLTALTPITIQTNPAGRSYTANGTNYSTSTTLNLAPGTSLALATTTPQTASGTRYDFANWSDGGAIAHNVAVSAAAQTITANFNTFFQLNHSKAGTGQGTVSPASGGYYPSGSSQQLTVTPAACSLLGGFSANAPNGLVSMTGPQNVTVTLNDNTARLAGALTAAGAGSGQVKFTFAGNRRVTGTNRWRRTYNLRNTGAALTGVVVAVDPPFTNVSSVTNGNGLTACASPLGSVFINVGTLAAGATKTLTVEVETPNPNASWSASFRALASGKP